MSRFAAVALYALYLIAGTAYGGAEYTDQLIDSRFAPTASPANWRRVFSNGTVDEKGVAVARTPDGGFVSLISVPGGSVGSKIGLVRYGPDGVLFTGSFGRRTRRARLAHAGLGQQLHITLRGAVLGQGVQQVHELARVHGLGAVLVGAEAAVEVPEVRTLGQIAAAFALLVFADVVLDGVEHAVRVFALDMERIGFAHDGPW